MLKNNLRVEKHTMNHSNFSWTRPLRWAKWQKNWIYLLAFCKYEKNYFRDFAFPKDLRRIRMVYGIIIGYMALFPANFGLWLIFYHFSETNKRRVLTKKRANVSVNNRWSLQILYLIFIFFFFLSFHFYSLFVSLLLGSI